MRKPYSPVAVIGALLGGTSLFAGILSGIPALIVCIAGIIHVKKNDKYQGLDLCTIGIILSLIAVVFYVGRI